MAGSGKSAMARRVAAMVRLPCVDVDHAVVQQRGAATVAEVFAEVGEDGFRELEAAALAEALARPEPAVIATGGGIVERSANREALARDARVVWLRATDEVLAQRLRNSSVRRPLLEGDLDANLRKLGARRQPWYEELSDLTIDVGPGDLVDTLAMVAARITERWPDLELREPA
jgi:shikimate kinase